MRHFSTLSGGAGWIASRNHFMGRTRRKEPNMSNISRREVLCGSAGLMAAAGLSLTAAGEPAPAGKKLKLVVAGAHPDDPESASGGLMALCADAGHEVVSLYLTRGEAGIGGKSHDEAARIRTAEAEAACRVLGARPVFADQIDGATELNAARYDAFTPILERENPDIVVTHWPIDGHRDHRVAAMLVYDAWLRMSKSFALYYFEVEMGIQSQHFYPTDYVDITAVEKRKKKACYEHESQNAKHGFYPLHEDMHLFRGKEAGVKAAEAYSKHRHGALSL